MRDSLPPAEEGRTRRTIRRIRRRSRWYYLLLLAAAVLVGTVLVTWLVLGSEAFQRWAGRRAGEELTELLGETVRIERIEVLLGPPGAQLHGLEIRHHATDAALVTAGEVQATLGWRDGKPYLHTLALRDVLVDLSVDDNGLTAFRSLPTGGGQKLERLPWDNLEIDGAEVHFAWPAGSVDVRDLSLIPTGAHQADLTGLVALDTPKLELTTALDWPGITLGPDVIDIPSLLVDTELGTIAGSATIGLAGTGSATLDAALDLPRLDPLLREDQALHGQAKAHIELAGLPTDAAAQVHLDVTGLGFDQVTPAGWPLSYELGDLVADATVTPEGIHLQEALVSWGDQRFTVSADIDPQGNVENGRVLGTRVSLARLLRDLDAAPTPWVDFSGEAEVAVEGTLSPLLLEGSYVATLKGFRVHDRDVRDPAGIPYLQMPWLRSTGQLTLRPTAIELVGSAAATRTRRGWVTASIGFLPKGPLDVVFDLGKADLEDFAPLGGARLAGEGRVKGRLWGPFDKLQLAGFAALDDFETVSVPFADHIESAVTSDMKRIVLTDAEAQVGASRYRGDLTLDFTDGLALSTDLILPEGRVEDFVHMFLDLDAVQGDMEGTLTLHGPLYDLTGEAHMELSGVTLFDEVFPTGVANGYMDFGRFTLDELRLERPDLDGGLWVRGSIEREWALNMEVLTDEVTLQSLALFDDVPLPLTGRVSGLATLGGTLFEPEPKGQLRIVDARYGGRPVADSDLWFSTGDGVMTVSALLLGGTVATEGTLDLWTDQAFNLDWTLDEFPAHTLYPVAADDGPITATATGTVHTAGSWLGTEGLPLTIDGRLDEVDVAWSRHELHNATPWRYRQLGDEYSLFGFSLSGGQSWVTLDASDDERGFAMRGEGRLEADLLRAIVPGLQRADGSARLSLSSRGSGQGARTQVEASMSADLVRHAAWPAAFEDVELEVRATGDGFEITRAEAAMGGGTLVGAGTERSLGTITAEDWMPTRFDLAARASDVQLQYTTSLPPAVGDAWIRFDGPVDNLLLGGEIDVREMVFSERIDWEDSVVSYRSSLLADAAPSEEEGLFALDLHVLAPEGTIQLDNNVAEGRAQADLTIVGDTARPGIVGEVVVRPGGSFFLQDRAFRLERGIVAFRDPFSWDPDLDFDLLASINSFDQLYRIHYLVSGPFSAWRTQTRSDPPLAQADINSLLYFGVTTDDLEGMGELPLAVAQGVADLVLTDLFVSPQLKELSQDLVFFDRFDIVTGVTSRGDYSSDPRLVFEKYLDAPFEATFTGEINLFELQNQFFRLERQLLPQAKLSAWWATKQRDRSLAIGGAYGIDVKLEWEVE